MNEPFEVCEPGPAHYGSEAERAAYRNGVRAERERVVRVLREWQDVMRADMLAAIIRHVMA